MEPISPINKALIEKVKLNNNQTSKNVQVQTPVPKLSADSVELSTKTQKQGLIDKIKSNKKLLIAGGVAIAAATAGIIFGIKKGIIPFGVNAKAKNILKRSDEILAQGSDIIALGQKEYNEAMGLLNQARENGFSDVLDESGKVIRNFDISNNPALSSTMREFSDGKLTRRVYFSQIDNEFNISSIDKGVEELSDGAKTAERFDFSNGVLSGYTKGWELFADLSEKIAEGFGFSDGVLNIYTKGTETLVDDSAKVDEIFNFSNGVLSGYTKGWEILADERQKIAEGLGFSNGVLSDYTKGWESLADGAKKAAISNKYENGKLISHQKNIEL